MAGDQKPIRLNVNAAIFRDGKLLVIKFSDASGIHYNFPGGGLDSGETIQDGLMRECQEEANARVHVGRLLVLWEYVPQSHSCKFGDTPKVGMIFECSLEAGSEPSMPTAPDKNQIGVEWIPLERLKETPSPRRHPILPAIEKELLAALASNSPIHITSAV